MKYALDSDYMPYLIDEYKTGGLGGYAKCSGCGAQIADGERYFDIDGKVFCMNCSATAEEHIMEKVREEYIFEA